MNLSTTRQIIKLCEENKIEEAIAILKAELGKPTQHTKDQEDWGILVLRLLRKIGVVNSDTDPSIVEVVAAAEDAIEHFEGCQKRIEQARSTPGQVILGSGQYPLRC